VKKTQL